ncbi:hypothetical protein OF83DRAFT_823761 [Amylostereum chailletii]|nr:hypothetical protein OF83DRAFT_823761 [Amylostereum chailletii]
MRSKRHWQRLCPWGRQSLLATLSGLAFHTLSFCNTMVRQIPPRRVYAKVPPGNTSLEPDISNRKGRLRAIFPFPFSESTSSHLPLLLAPCCRKCPLLSWNDLTLLV